MKKQALWTRALLLALALVMMVSVFAACQPEEEEIVVTTEEPAGTDPSTSTEGFIDDALGDDLNFDRVVTILGDNADSKYCYYFTEEDLAKDVVKQSVFATYDKVQERLGVEFQWKFVNGGWGARNTFAKDVETAREDKPYDLMCCYNLVPYLLAQKGFCANLYGSQYLDFSAPWWPDALIDEILLNDTIYAVTESNQYGLLLNMMAMFFNTDLLDSKGLESPYDLVDNNQWTFDKFASMIKETYEDTNGDGKFDSGDIYGFINQSTSKSDAWFYALGYKYSEMQGDQLVSLVNDPSIQEYIDKMLVFYDSKDVMKADVPEFGGVKQGQMFFDKRAVFYSAAVITASWIAELESDVKYGVVPMPKGSAEQDRYYTHISNSYNTWCVSDNVADLDCSSAVLECLASEEYRTVGPLYYETYVKLRYASDEKLAPMYDLVRDSVTFDLVYLCSCAYPNADYSPKEIVKWCVLQTKSKPGFVWSSSHAMYKDTWNTAFDNILLIYAP